MKKAMILFAKGFPYNVSEPFLENEYPMYKDYFDKVLIVTGCKKAEIPTRVVEDPAIEILCDYTLSKDLKSILQALPRVLTDKMFYQEIALLRKQHRFTKQRFLQALSVSLCGNHREMLAEKWIKMHPEYEVSVIYSYWLQITAYAAVKLNDRLFHGKKFTISRTHGFDLYQERMKTQYLPFQGQLCTKLSAIAAISQNGKDYLEQKYHYEEKTFVYRLGALDRQHVNPCADRETFRMVSCARVVPIKRLHKIIEALMTISDASIEWTHIGGGAGLDELKKQAQQLPANITVNFTGTVDNTKVYDIYGATPFHVFLNVSETEGVPVSVMEAMSFQIPVIATAVGGTAELVDDKVNGFLLDKDFSTDELRTAIVEMKEMPGVKYQSFRENARKKFLSHYNAIPNYRMFVEMLAEKR